MDSKPDSGRVDELVDRLLRDKDFLLAQEIKLKAEELNQLFAQAQRNRLRIEIEPTELELKNDETVTWLNVKILMEI